MTGEAQHDGQKYGIAGNAICQKDNCCTHVVDVELHENVTLNWQKTWISPRKRHFDGEMMMFAPGAESDSTDYLTPRNQIDNKWHGDYCL